MIYLLLATTFSFNTNWRPTQDKISHAFMGYGISSIIYTYFTWMENEEDDRQMKIAASIASAVVIGFIKEDWDLYRGEGIADFYDWSYTIVGGIIGTIMTDWIYRKIPNL